jgi:RecA-family ATPase
LTLPCNASTARAGCSLRSANASIEERALAGDDHAEPLQVVSLKNLMSSELPKQAYAIERILPYGHITLLGAHGGAGKSILSLTWAAHFADGRIWNGMHVDFGPALYCSLEDSAPVVKQRLQRIVRSYDLDPTNVCNNLTVLDGTAGHAALGVETQDMGVKGFSPTEAYFDLETKAAKANFIIIDNASDGFDGNENERRSVRRFVRMLARLARPNNAAVLLLAHIDKAAARNGANGNTYSGSTAWHNSSRSRLALVPSNHDIELIHEKHNLGRLAENMLLTWNAEGVLVPQTATSNNTAAAKRQAEEDDAGVIAAFEAAAAQSVSVPSTRTGGGTAFSILRTFAELPAHLSATAGKQRFWSALDRLQKVRRIERESYQTEQRKQRERLVLK